MKTLPFTIGLCLLCCIPIFSSYAQIKIEEIGNFIVKEINISNEDQLCANNLYFIRFQIFKGKVKNCSIHPAETKSSIYDAIKNKVNALQVVKINTSLVSDTNYLLPVLIQLPCGVEENNILKAMIFLPVDKFARYVLLKPAIYLKERDYVIPPEE